MLEMTIMLIDGAMVIAVMLWAIANDRSRSDQDVTGFFRFRVPGQVKRPKRLTMLQQARKN